MKEGDRNYSRKYRLRRNVSNTILNILVVIIVLICILPYLWVVVNAIKPRIAMISKIPVDFFKPTLKNFKSAIETYDALRYLKNTAIIAIGNTIIAITIGIPAAYGFSRMKYRGKKYLLFYILATTMVPPITIAVPMYILFSKFGLIDNYLGIIMADATYNVVFVAWLMKGFFDELPPSLEESAKVDGCSQFKAFLFIAFPLVAPGIVTVSIFSFIFSWNDLIYSLVLTGDNTRPLTVAIPQLVVKSGTLWGVLSSIALMQTVPIIVLTILALKNLVRGLTLGAVKG
jgi:multiple sugar transport system permease protein